MDRQRTQPGAPVPDRRPAEEGSETSWSQDEEPIAEVLKGFGVNAALVEEIRQRYEVDPTSVHPSWGKLFEPASHLGEAPLETAAAAEAQLEAVAPREIPPLNREEAEKHARVLRLIHSYRARGHRVAAVDPLGGQPSYFPELDPAHYGFGHEDLERSFIAGDLPGGPVQPLRQILERLRATYCRSVGVEFTHIQDPGRKTWLQLRLEESSNTTPLNATERLRILEKLSAAELFERFLHTKFLGQKRYSLEGAESLIPLLDTIVEDAPLHGMAEFVIGMAHRGRLNVLSNILGRSLEALFSEFEDIPILESPFGSGDVKYHKGFSTDRRTRRGPSVHLSLTSNPSHLEAVNPVVEGRTRAKQMRAGDTRGRTIVPVLIHGDAAMAGQGIVAETLNLSNLAGYSTGGTIHVVVNNQIGFTATPAETRSTLYCTDIAKMLQAPIFHVNADDPEAVVHCVKEAMAYRQRFLSDVVIDMVCYRRHGHNEGDEPSFTQPLLYEKIRNHPGVRRLYTDKLLQLGLLREEDVRRIDADLSGQLARALQGIKTKPPTATEPYEPLGPWTGFSRTCPPEDPQTGVPVERLAQIAEGLGAVPGGFHLHPKLASLLERRRKGIAENAPIDWALAEALAFGSLVCEGTRVRLSGQDSVRGTFSQRHAAITDQMTGEEYVPLDHLSTTQARFEAYDSLLSEAGVLGFEYGYSLADPQTLTLWEAQFGDFANGAQVIIDQFISSAHVKWGRISGLVMLLPHGYEGQGPEHSSARVERFLQLCSEDNLQIVNCTTPAQYFHVLRRQMRRNFRAPLIIFTPKSLLRAPRAASRSEDLVSGSFQRLIDDARALAAPERVRRVLLCGGKVYYDLLDAKEKRVAGGTGAGEVALVRVEQLYPWPAAPLASSLERYARADRVFWVQEEPANMGAWTFVRERIQDALLPSQQLAYAGRPESASTAVGSLRLHKEQQAALVAAAFSGLG
ncbi:MAG TPA: 2-oxoglutarate dehydrogenase E1 component [Deltaproteobacteria bacterium]|jgi:2-oxoglutarate dehydrogenase E1 component|nr:2-oxoglutarate dehydrogenase E1 component [Deltaproteobacteria bacterium]